MGKMGEREHVWVLFCEESSEKSPKNLLGGESSSGEMMKLTIPLGWQPVRPRLLPDIEEHYFNN
jgi:hypothetical protein